MVRSVSIFYLLYVGEDQTHGDRVVDLTLVPCVAIDAPHEDYSGQGKVHALC